MNQSLLVISAALICIVSSQWGGGPGEGFGDGQGGFGGPRSNFGGPEFGRPEGGPATLEGPRPSGFLNVGGDQGSFNRPGEMGGQPFGMGGNQGFGGQQGMGPGGFGGEGGRFGGPGAQFGGPGGEFGAQTPTPVRRRRASGSGHSLLQRVLR
nr:unnamed protein product [Haemonchus contortus]